MVARLDSERGREAAAEALAWAFEHWDEVRVMSNPCGYLYRVGVSKTRPRKSPALDRPAPVTVPLPEPELWSALARLSPRQRVAVVMVYGYGMRVNEVAELTNTTSSSVKTHARRGLSRLRRVLGPEDGGKT